MNNGDYQIAGEQDYSDNQWKEAKEGGLTKREHFSLHLMASICSGCAANLKENGTNDYCEGAWPCYAESTAVKMADALLRELDK